MYRARLLLSILVLVGLAGICRAEQKEGNVVEGGKALTNGFSGGRLYMLTEGSWSKAGGIDVPAVGSAFGVNGDAADVVVVGVRLQMVF